MQTANVQTSIYTIGVAPITQVTHVPNKNSNSLKGGHLMRYK